MTPAALILTGALSVYGVNDGYNNGELACGGRLTDSSRHIAIRNWRGHCGQRVRVCSQATRVCVVTKVQDSGPWGAVSPDGTWRCWPKPLPKGKGWRRRAVVDLTRPLWIELGRPPFLSQVRIEIFRKPPRGEV